MGSKIKTVKCSLPTETTEEDEIPRGISMDVDERELAAMGYNGRMEGEHQAGSEGENETPRHMGVDLEFVQEDDVLRDRDDRHGIVGNEHSVSTSEHVKSERDSSEGSANKNNNNISADDMELSRMQNGNSGAKLNTILSKINGDHHQKMDPMSPEPYDPSEGIPHQIKSFAIPCTYTRLLPRLPLDVEYDNHERDLILSEGEYAIITNHINTLLNPTKKMPLILFCLGLMSIFAGVVAIILDLIATYFALIATGTIFIVIAGFKLSLSYQKALRDANDFCMGESSKEVRMSLQSVPGNWWLRGITNWWFVIEYKCVAADT